MTIVELRVHMDCPGCERRVTKALSKLDGVDNVDIDMNMQKVTVTGRTDQKKVLKKVRSTGRTAELWPFPYNPEYHSYYNPDPNSGYTATPNYYTAQPSSKYNYYKHGYNGHQHGYYQQPPSSTVINERATTMFSDDNATGCSIM
ncbi:hypothetical protein ABFS83_13G097200 [Erythranthe nasuta]